LAPEDVAALLAEVVARGSRCESFLRLSLLTLVGDARAGEGFAGRLGALPLDVDAAGDGWPAPLAGRGLATLPLGDTSFSSGQQVIGGLVLLMAMVEGEGRGFFMLDEPFAHLSIDRIDDVGRFLRSSGAQFVITAPTTLDRAQLDPASLVIALRKKRPEDGHAPVPLVAEA
jgi:hypothetical protein